MADREIDLSGLAGDGPAATEQLTRVAQLAPAVQVLQLVGVEGPAAGTEARSTGERFSIGSDQSNDLVVDDSTASRFHCEIVVGPRGAWLRDLGSRNGTVLDGVPIVEAGLREGSLIQLGRSTLRLHIGDERQALPLSERHELGTLVGESVPMRTLFALMERAAETEATVLVQGETGTGKESVAETIHRLGPRRDQPFLVVDCAALPPNLLESELFGHERGAFTGADVRRIGVFEEADGGTVFVDEIGELPLELQPRLLRVLERREIRRLGSNQHRKVNVRVVAATHRDLRAQVNEGRFRADLYFRLAVLRLSIPPLRERPEDIAILADRLLADLGADPPARAELLDRSMIARLQRGVWPGNVRELRNYLERCMVMESAAPLSERAPEAGAASQALSVDPSVPYSEAKRRLLDQFERQYLTSLLEAHAGNVSAAARAAGMDRVYVYKLLRKHAIRR
ncbi:MAG: sigma 54-interacting transcriptional regulator [Deltaproteobacteria bacterium]|nr:sigma 54-interacting transcriptional regulator [Deltaproteobacteria bacterium]MBW2534688.1 sigma 54-interacting transcriptional regulator [Deltaproteobacteria bacterium]